MIPLQELREQQRKTGIALEVLEKDYCLGWLLKGIADSPLSSQAVLKGGTALRKLYFSDYRFSEDLDFTTLLDLSEDTLRASISTACTQAQTASGVRFTLTDLEQTREVPQETAWQARVEFIGPRQQTRSPRRIRLDLTAYEQVLLPPARRPIFHSYSDAFNADLPVYTLEEILAEKLRTILQRGYPRDVYDTWYLLTHAPDQIDLRRAAAVFRRKCAYKGVDAGDVDHFFKILEEKNTAVHWTASLGAQIRNLPPFDQLQVGLRGALTRLLTS